MSEVASWLADPTVRHWYLLFCFAVMFLPMIGLSIWYHRNIGKTPGGRALMDRQSRSFLNSPGIIWPTAKKSRKDSGMMRDISSGKYGGDARRMQTKVYWFCGFWLLANVICFGILIWADEFNK